MKILFLGLRESENSNDDVLDQTRLRPLDVGKLITFWSLKLNFCAILGSLKRIKKEDFESSG